MGLRVSDPTSAVLNSRTLFGFSTISTVFWFGSNHGLVKYFRSADISQLKTQRSRNTRILNSGQVNISEKATLAHFASFGRRSWQKGWKHWDLIKLLQSFMLGALARLITCSYQCYPPLIPALDGNPPLSARLQLLWTPTKGISLFFFLIKPAWDINELDCLWLCTFEAYSSHFHRHLLHKSHAKRQDTCLLQEKEVKKNVQNYMQLKKQVNWNHFDLSIHSIKKPFLCFPQKSRKGSWSWFFLPRPSSNTASVCLLLNADNMVSDRRKYRGQI